MKFLFNNLSTRKSKDFAVDYNLENLHFEKLIVHWIATTHKLYWVFKLKRSHIVYREFNVVNCLLILFNSHIIK